MPPTRYMTQASPHLSLIKNWKDLGRRKFSKIASNSYVARPRFQKAGLATSRKEEGRRALVKRTLTSFLVLITEETLPCSHLWPCGDVPGKGHCQGMTTSWELLTISRKTKFRCKLSFLRNGDFLLTCFCQLQF